MNREQEIIYDLLYSDDLDMSFDVTDMCENIEEYNDLIDSIVSKVNRGGVYVIQDSISVINIDHIYWKVKVKRN